MDAANQRDNLRIEAGRRIKAQMYSANDLEDMNEVMHDVYERIHARERRLQFGRDD